jgi:muconolactone delta-isomerase
MPGATNVTDLVAMDGSNHAAVVFDVDDPDALMAVLSSIPPEMAAQAESHGVPGGPGTPAGHPSNSLVSCRLPWPGRRSR